MMNQPGTTRQSSWLRLVLVVTGGLAPRAHAQTTITVSSCDESHLDVAISQANSDNADDTIGRSMTLSGSGQSVTLDGQNCTPVLDVKSGVSFTLNALTMANGFSNFGSGGLFNQFGGTVSISNSAFDDNRANAGGSLFNDVGGTVNIGQLHTSLRFDLRHRHHHGHLHGYRQRRHEQPGKRELHGDGQGRG